MTALLEVGYDYVLSFEHEDPVMSEEDGCEQCIQFLKPDHQEAARARLHGLVARIARPPEAKGRDHG